MSATYILGTPIGTVRQLLGDTDVTVAVWEDEEIQAFIDRYSNYEIVAANLMEGAADDAARMAIIANNDGSTDLTKIATLLREGCARLRANAITSPTVPVTDAAFTIGSTTLGTVGSMDAWW
jgi:hypothetical protein